MQINWGNLLIVGVLAVTGFIVSVPQVQAHCQIPCGIYDDHARVKLLFEDTETIEKSIKLIAELSGESDPQSHNQLVRWVINKETHAQNIISAISGYFLTQRVNPSQQDYAQRLIKHHAVIVAAMKAKQSAEGKVVEDLRKVIEVLATYYREDSN